jgi:hypothetical protein
LKCSATGPPEIKFARLVSGPTELLKLALLHKKRHQRST